MNIIPEIAKALGVEIEEKFKIENYGKMFYFTIHSLRTDGEPPASIREVLSQLIHGETEIIKLPFRPKSHQCFWFVDVTENRINYDFWNSSTASENFYLMGNCFATAEEARKNQDKVMERYLNWNFNILLDKEEQTDE